MARIRTRRLQHCPMCGSNATEHWAQGRDNLFKITDQTFEYRKCTACRTVYNADQPVESDIGLAYPDLYGPYGTPKRARWIEVPEALNAACNRLADRIIDAPEFAARLARFYDLRPGDRLLDFGCGAGKFLDSAKKKGCETVGVDFSEQVISRLGERGHVGIHVSDEGWQRRYAGHFTMIRMNHVIEHVMDPRRTMEELLATMSPGGRIHIATPNAEGVAAETYREFWWGLECPRHLIMMPPERLARLLEECGFVRVELVYEPITKDLARSWAYRKAGAGAYDFAKVEGLASDGLLNLRFAFQARRALGSGRSDRIHVLAYRS